MHDSMKRLHEVSGVNRKNAIAKQLDVSPSTVTNWSTRGVSKEGAIAAADIYNTDANYILNGDESRKPIGLTELEVFRKEHLTGKPGSELPILNLVSFSNYSDINKDNRNICDWMDRATHLSPGAFGFLVLGRSMQPEFKAGEIVIIEVDINISDIKDGDYVLAQCKKSKSGSGVLKQVIIGSDANDIYLEQINKDIPNRDPLTIEDFHILGIVDSKITKYR